MNSTIQTIVVVIIGLIAVRFLVLKFFYKPKKKTTNGDCGDGDCGCH